jgi:chromosome segregation protein
MRLKKLILHGFKSFADRTEFSFDSAITGIVGPNGCGKSNVVDAFKWVLGEQSAKSLRGEAMMDVIFNGAASRKPAGMAEVTLVFDNPTNGDGRRALNLEIDEVAVGRRLFRDGTSEYHVNNQVGRLKDVRELFFDTGVGVDAYSVIEQGRVAALLDANPQERRLIFEEAAGISKFKQRKKEAQRKLERVDQNLLRVNDVVEELEKRLRSVKAQAGRARTYQEYTARLSELRLSYALHEYHQLSTKLAELEKSREDAQFRLDDANGDLSSTQNRLADRRERHARLSEQRQGAERDLVQSQAAAQSARQRQHYAKQQLEQIAEQSQTLQQDQSQLESKLAEVSKSLLAENVLLAELTQQVASQRSLINERQKAFGDCQIRLGKIDQDREQAKAVILDTLRRLAGVNSRLGALEIERKNVSAQGKRLTDRQKIVADDLGRLESAGAELRQKLEQTKLLMSEQQSQLESKRSEALAIGKQIAQVGEQLGAAREHRCGLDSRRKMLEDLEARREGVSEGVKSVLGLRQSTFNFVRGLVADVLRVDIEHAPVIEAALDGRDQWLVTNDSNAAAAAREALAELEGRVNFLCVDLLPAAIFPSPGTPGEGQGEGLTNIDSGMPSPQPSPGLPGEGANAFNWKNCAYPVRLAIDLVQFEPTDLPIATALLGRTAVVEDLAAAVELRRQLPAGFRLVTQNGEVLEPDGTLKAGPLSAAMGLLSRRSELQSVSQQIAEVDGRIEQFTRQLADDNTAARALEDEIGSLRNAIYASNTAVVQTGGALAQNSDLQGNLKREQPILAAELRSLDETAKQLDAEQTKLIEQRQILDQKQAEKNQQVEDLTAAQRVASEESAQLNEQLMAARVEAGQTQEKQLASSQAVQRQTAAQGELKEQIERVSKSAASLVARREGVEKELASAAHAEVALADAEKTHQAKVAELTDEVSEIAKAVETLTSQVESLRSRRQDVEQELHKIEMSSGEETVRMQGLIQRTQEELQLDLPQRYAELESAEASPVNFDEVAVEIKELREKIQRLGNVNVEAINELAELETRQQFLSTQLTDLTGSKEQLTQLIDEINKESSIRFETTFNAVREHFQGMFRKLFGGGKADLFLETELPAAATAEGEAPALPVMVDVLDAGIEVIARPPGKQPVTISQLSGGEKTMTCVALLLSIFKSKPSPFCILDEVDAALDEANNSRFNSVIQEFLDQSQFIVITHSKRTMKIAEMLYGVTMQEQGVSKRVSVKFDQVDSQGRIAEHAAA